MSNELDGFCLRPLQLKKWTSSRYNALSVYSFFHWPLAFDWFPNFSWLIVSPVQVRLFWYKVLTHGTKFNSSPFSSTTVAFLFWFLLWFACILAFWFELRVDVASLELTFGCFYCFVRQLFPLLCLHFAVVFSSCRGSSSEIEISVIRIAVRGVQFLLKKLIYHLANQSTPTKSWNLAHSEKSLKIKPIPLFTKSLSSIKRTMYHHAGRHYFLTALNINKFANLSGNQFVINSSVSLV